ncbi:hypothetical protein [Micromonospora profundi]|uniref:hypothetical protein n=1 Tax=Micromonospora TaxID=1873 RepID=UPI0033A371E8
MASIWRDFLIAVVTALRKPDERSLAEERRRAVERLADQTIRKHQPPADPPE